MPEHFTVSRENACLLVTIDRAETGNMITDPMLVDLAALVREAGADEALHAVVLRGAGGTFCHGRERGPTPGGPPRNAHDAHQRMFSRILEVYAAFLEHTDAQVGKLVDALEELDILDDTLFDIGKVSGNAVEWPWYTSVAPLRWAATAKVDEGPRNGQLLRVRHPW